MGGGSRVPDRLPPELADEVVATSSSSTSTSDHQPDGPSSSEEEAVTCYNRRRCKGCLELMKTCSSSPTHADALRAAKDVIVRHKPGDWIEEVGGTTFGDYEVPETITLLLVGPGSGKSTLINRITRVFDDDLSAPDRAQVSHSLSATGGTCFLQEYPIPRNSKSLCIYDTRSLCMNPSENFKLLQRWMTRGVSHGEMVIRDSDDYSMRNRMMSMSRKGLLSCCKKRMVNFVIFVVDGVSVLKSVCEKENEYNEMLFETFNYPFLSFKDNKPAVAITHGDELSLPERAHVRTHLANLLGIPPTEIFDIPGTSEYDTEMAIVDMLRYCIEHADRNLALENNYSLQVYRMKIGIHMNAENAEAFFLQLLNLVKKTQMGQRICGRLIEKFQDYDMIIEVVIISLCFVILILRGIGTLL